MSLRTLVRALGIACGTGALLALATGVAQAAPSPTINASINEVGQIGMSFADGTPIGTFTAPGPIIPPGTYTITVNDSADVFDFHLFGPGVDQFTGVDSTGIVTWTVTFQPNSTYVYDDDQHADLIFATFRTASSATSSTSTAGSSTGQSTGSTSGGGTSTNVQSNTSTTKGSGTASTGGVVGSAVVPFRGTLDAVVSAAGAVSLKDAGKPVQSLKSGRYTIDVSDQSKRSSFILQEIHKSARTVTGALFIGSHKLTLSLLPGQWFFYPSFVGKKTYFIVVA